MPDDRRQAARREGQERIRPDRAGAEVFDAGLDWLRDLRSEPDQAPTAEMAQLQARVAELEAALAVGGAAPLREAQEAAERYRTERDGLLARLGQGVVRLPLAAVYPDPAQPRFLPPIAQLREAAAAGEPHAARMVADLEALGRSMLPPPAGVGQLQPIRVYEDLQRPGQYVILVGHRRRMAAELAGLAEIEALVGPAPDAGRMAQQLVENVHRAELSAVERAWGLRRLKEVLEQQAGSEVPWSAVEARCQVGERYRQRLTALLQLPQEAQKIAARAGLSEWALRPLVRAAGDLAPDVLVELTRKVAQGRTTPAGEVQPLGEAEVAALVTRSLVQLHQAAPAPMTYPKWVAARQQRWHGTALAIAGLVRRRDLTSLPAAALAVLKGTLDEVEQAAREARARVERVLARQGDQG